MKTQRYGSDLTIKLRLAAYDLGVKPISAKASIADKEAFLSLTSKALKLHGALKSIAAQIDEDSGSPTFTSEEHEDLVALYTAFSS